ncbi:hypothetical protein DVH24_024549 [Malus domestica]|uniref:RING-type E3 ubiquitin transferase n=1 Tax=Malus domestica TaxID=3750 RepID=A0A498JIR1_MALDO|nr:hypothetical protein DVH24_024549 [Malus domestica]
MEETRQLAELGLSCAELRRRDRPDLKEQVVPLLERLKEVADTAKNSAPPVQCLPPNHFICPILKDVMDDHVWPQMVTLMTAKRSRNGSKRT